MIKNKAFCTNCRKEISLGEEIFVREENVFCSKDCGLEHYGVIESVLEENYFEGGY